MHDPRRHPGFGRVFPTRGLTLGVFFPIEAYAGDTPTMRDQESLARRAEQLGFSALWFRDVPLRDPSFGDVGQIYDPFVYLAHIAAQTRRIALATGAIVLPLRHPLHVAKAAASIDRLSGGRLVLGVAAGDRTLEYEAFGVDHAARGELLRAHLSRVRRAFAGEPCAAVGSAAKGLEALPAPLLSDLPVVVTGRSQQALGFIAAHGDAFVSYPRAPRAQLAQIAQLRAAAVEVGVEAPPFGQSLYVDLLPDPRAFHGDIHLGYALGRERLIELLAAYEEVGVAHVALNLKYGKRPANDVIEELGAEVVPRFQAAQR